MIKWLRESEAVAEQRSEDVRRVGARGGGTAGGRNRTGSALACAVIIAAAVAFPFNANAQEEGPYPIRVALYQQYRAEIEARLREARDKCDKERFDWALADLRALRNSLLADIRDPRGAVEYLRFRTTLLTERAFELYRSTRAARDLHQILRRLVQYWEKQQLRNCPKPDMAVRPADEGFSIAYWLSELFRATDDSNFFTPPSGELGAYVGIEGAKNTGSLKITETLSAFGIITNEFSERNDPLGVGIVAGYYFRPGNSMIVAGPFASFDFLSQKINHTFPGGAFLGTQTRWIGNAGMKAGVVTRAGIFLYGIAGVGVLNQDLNINFGGPFVTSSNTTVPGFTLGLGGEMRPAFLQRFARPVSVFVQYQHTWWQDAKLNQPAASPLFNYNFRRADDTLRFGLNIHFGGPTQPPPAAPSPKIITK